MPVYGLYTVVAACATAVNAGMVSRDVAETLVQNLSMIPPEPVETSHTRLPELRIPPLADCRRYGLLLAGGAHAA